MIYVDSREPDDLVELIREKCDEVSVEGMDSGDFLVRDWLIERKRYSDLASRMKTTENDIFTQIFALLSASEEQDLNAVLLLEGSPTAQLARTQITVGQITRLIAGLAKLDGLQIVPTAGKEETSILLSKLEQGSTGSGPRSIRDTPNVPDEKIARYYVEGFNRVGPKTASKILEKFGSFQNVVLADVEELMDVPGVGTKTAEHIHESVRKEWDEDVEV